MPRHFRQCDIDAAGQSALSPEDPPIRPGLGSYLQAQREHHGCRRATTTGTRECNLFLSDLSQITKIRVALLKALENNETLTISGDFYTRGFLRAYAAAVGLNPGEIVRECLAQEAETQLGSTGGARQAQEGGAGQGRAEGQRASRARVLLGAGVAAVARILYVLWFERAGRTPIPAPPLDSSKPSVPPPEPKSL